MVGASGGSGRVVGVVGARGGAGATVLAGAFARRLGGPSRVVLVDGDVASPGLDVILGIEDEPGPRWPDLADARGDVAGTELAAALPRWAHVAVLSADRRRPGTLPDAEAADVVAELAADRSSVVVDLGRVAVRGREALLGRCDSLLLVVPRDLPAVAGALVLREQLSGVADDVRLVVRGPAPGGLGVAELVEVVGLPVAAVMRADRRVAGAVDRGEGPLVRSGPLARAVRRLTTGSRA